MTEILIALALLVHFFLILIMIGIQQSILREVIGIARRQQSDQIRNLYNSPLNYYRTDKVI